MSALLIASQNGHPEVVKMLLEGGADVNMQREVREAGLGCVCKLYFGHLRFLFVILVRMDGLLS